MNTTANTTAPFEQEMLIDYSFESVEDSLSFQMDLQRILPTEYDGITHFHGMDAEMYFYGQDAEVMLDAVRPTLIAAVRSGKVLAISATLSYNHEDGEVRVEAWTQC